MLAELGGAVTHEEGWTRSSSGSGLLMADDDDEIMNPSRRPPPIISVAPSITTLHFPASDVP